MSLVGFQADNHPQQTRKRGPKDFTDSRATPPEWFAELHARFRFTLDGAASATNHKLPRYYTKEQNGLLQPWTGERVWINPPFSNIPAWAEKAHRERYQADLIVMCVPANRTEQAWWHTYIEPYRDRAGSILRVEFIKGRQRFIRADRETVEADNRPPFGVCLLIWEAHQ